jgi:hypothetical protein
VTFAGQRPGEDFSDLGLIVDDQDLHLLPPDAMVVRLCLVKFTDAVLKKVHSSRDTDTTLSRKYL